VGWRTFRNELNVGQPAVGSIRYDALNQLPEEQHAMRHDQRINTQAEPDSLDFAKFAVNASLFYCTGEIECRKMPSLPLSSAQLSWLLK